MAPSKGVEIIINREVWDKKTRYDTADEVYFRLWRCRSVSILVPTIFDSAGNEATGIKTENRKSLYCHQIR